MTNDPDPFDRVDRAIAAFDERIAAEADLASAEWSAEAQFLEVDWPKVHTVAAGAMEEVAERLRASGHQAGVVESGTPDGGVAIVLIPRTIDQAATPARCVFRANGSKFEVEMITEKVGGERMGGGHMKAEEALALTREQLLDKLGSWVGGALNP